MHVIVKGYAQMIRELQHGEAIGKQFLQDQKNTESYYTTALYILCSLQVHATLLVLQTYRPLAFGRA